MSQGFGDRVCGRSTRALHSKGVKGPGYGTLPTPFEPNLSSASLRHELV